MKRPLAVVRLGLRVAALVSLTVLNTALPADASFACWSCFDAGGPAFCLDGAVDGHAYCQFHAGHCDLYGDCI
jgi:hypothetical protein